VLYLALDDIYALHATKTGLQRRLPRCEIVVAVGHLQLIAMMDAEEVNLIGMIQ
jgi:hypothetical protein